MCDIPHTYYGIKIPALHIIWVLLKPEEPVCLSQKISITINKHQSFVSSKSLEIHLCL